MNARIIPRSAHETYFIPAGQGRPPRREVAKYLSANHPLYSKACEVDSRIRTIAGSRFLLVTVLDIPSKKIRGWGFGTRLATATAILASSRYASLSCTIRCGDALVIFGPAPESAAHAATVPETPITDVVIDSDKDLLEFARKEKIRVSLFPTRWRIPAALSVLLCCAVLTSFMGLPRPATSPIGVQLVLGTIPVIESVPFREIFAAEIDAIYAAGAVMEDYRFDIRAKPETRIALLDGDPDIALRELRRIGSIGGVTADGLDYADGTLRYAVLHTVKVPVYGTESAADIPAAFAVIESLEALCASRTWKLSVSAAEDPVFSVSIPESEFPRFPESLFAWCTAENLAVTALHAARNGESSLFAVTLRFAHAPGRYGVPDFDPLKTGTVFGIAEKRLPPKKNQGTASRIALIGKIGDSSAGVYVFGRTSSGKIHVEKEQAK